jgi:hypothetical protein
MTGEIRTVSLRSCLVLGKELFSPRPRWHPPRLGAGQSKAQKRGLDSGVKSMLTLIKQKGEEDLTTQEANCAPPRVKRSQFQLPRGVTAVITFNSPLCSPLVAARVATMPPNARPVTLIYEPEEPSVLNDALLDMLDKKADTAGLANISADNEDWTDVKHSERKKRDRVLDDGVLIKLMRKSDYKGFERLFVNLSIMAATAYAINNVMDGQGPRAVTNLSLEKLALFVPLYFFYGFQFQCFAFAGQHEFLHRNAFKTKLYNDICLFFVGLFCFELGVHEKVMHKQVCSISSRINALTDVQAEAHSRYPLHLTSDITASHVHQQH